MLRFTRPSHFSCLNRRSRPLDLSLRFIPYCSSDVWSGATAKTEQSKGSASQAYGPVFRKRIISQFRLSLSCVCRFACVGGYAFMGSLIIQEVVKDLLSKGLDNAKVLLLAGSRYVLLT